MTEKKRQAAVINTFYIKTLNENEPQIAEFAKADILQAMLSKRFVFVLNINILPYVQEESFENFDEKDTESFNRNWYHDNTKVGDIG